MEQKNIGPAQWYEQNRENPGWWRAEHYWNIGCHTCEFNFGGICAGARYGAPVAEISQEEARSCRDWGISLDAFGADLRRLEGKEPIQTR